MTHFRCAVFSYDPNRFEDLLAPYGEEDESRFVFIEAEMPEEKLKSEYIINRNKHPDEDTYPDFEDWLECIGYHRENGIIGYYGNPNAKWDWYRLDGGDWQFSLKDGEEYNDDGNARKNQFCYIDENFSFRRTRELYDKLKDDAENSDNEYVKKNAKEMLKVFPTLQDYERYMVYKMPAAFITPDGKWHSAGNIGWFATSDSTAESRKTYYEEWVKWIDDEERNPYVNFVDCHI